LLDRSPIQFDHVAEVFAISNLTSGLRDALARWSKPGTVPSSRATAIAIDRIRVRQGMGLLTGLALDPHGVPAICKRTKS